MWIWGHTLHNPLEVEIKNDDVCLYIKREVSFLEKDKASAWYLVLIKQSSITVDASINVFDKKIMLNEQKFPVKRESCILVPIKIFELNKPYEFIIDTGKNFYERACILRKGNGYEVKKVHSTENCDE